MLRWLLPLLALPPLLALAFYLLGNGPTLPAFALSTLPALLLCAWALRHSRRHRRLALWMLGLIVWFDFTYIMARIDKTSPGKAAMRLCVDGDCSGSPPIESRLAPESETAMAGLSLSSFLGGIKGAERDELERLLRLEYAAFDAVPALAALPNAPLAGLRPWGRRYLLHMPAGVDRPPCLVFLHGFGGQLSIYLKTLLESDLARTHAIVAPFGGPVGLWWSKESQERLHAMLTQDLPASIDRGRISLVGLSNGAVGATVLATSPRFEGMFHRVVALSGVGWAAADLARTPPLLVLSGQDDPRFGFEHVERAVEGLRARKLRVELQGIPGDHFIILSRKQEVWRRIQAWIERPAAD